MGWGRTLLLGDIGNRLDIEDVEHEIQRLKDSLVRTSSSGEQQDLQQDQRIAALEEQVSELRRDVDETTLYVAGLVELLVSRDVITEQEFSRLVATIED